MVKPWEYRECPHDTAVSYSWAPRPICSWCGLSLPNLGAGERGCGCGRDVRVFGHEPGCNSRAPRLVDERGGALRLGAILADSAGSGHDG